MSASEANRVFETVGLFHARTLFRGSLEGCLACPYDFQSLIPQWLGLPPIETHVRESSIIRPEEPRYLANGPRVPIRRFAKTRTKHAKKQLGNALIRLVKGRIQDVAEGLWP